MICLHDLPCKLSQSALSLVASPTETTKGDARELLKLISEDISQCAGFSTMCVVTQKISIK